jgi:hypothetical protein
MSSSSSSSAMAAAAAPLQPARERSPLPDGRVWKGQEQHFPPGQPGSVFLVAPHTMGVTAVAHAVSERNRVGAIVRRGPDRGLTAAMPFLVISGEDVQCKYKPLRGGTKCGKMLLAANAYRCARHARKHRMAERAEVERTKQNGGFFLKSWLLTNNKKRKRKTSTMDVNGRSNMRRRRAPRRPHHSRTTTMTRPRTFVSPDQP